MLTPLQLATLKTAILAETDSEFITYINSGATGAMADFYNKNSSPAFTVWKTAVGKDEITQNGFDWTRLDNLNIGKARVWDGLFDNASRTTNPSKSNVRAGIETVWVGTAADLAVRAQIYVHCKRIATRAERLYATGTGTNLSPGILVFEGFITNGDIELALEL